MLFAVGNFHFDVPGLRVGESVAQCLTGDAEYLHLKERVQGLRAAFNYHRELRCWRVVAVDRAILVQLFTQAHDLMSEIGVRGSRGTNIQDSISTLDNGLLRAIQGAVESLDGFLRTIGKEVASALKVQRQTLKTLQQRIMQLAGNPRAFRQALLELQIQAVGHQPDAPHIASGSQSGGGQKADEVKPTGLIEGGKHIEIEGGGSFVPDAIAVGSHDVKTIRARAEIGVIGLAGGERVAPTAVETLEMKAVTDTFWRGKAQAGVRDGQPLVAGRNANGSVNVERGAIRENGVKVDEGERSGSGRASWVNDSKPAVGRKPNIPSRIREDRLLAFNAFRANQTVGNTVFAQIGVGQRTGE